MIVVLSGNDFHYETENLCRLFFPYDKIKVIDKSAFSGSESEFSVYAYITCGENEIEYKAGIFNTSYSGEDTSPLCGENEKERILCVLLFRALCAYTGKTPLWGILTGIHPVKKLRKLSAEYGEENAEKIFREKYLVSSSKTHMAKRIMNIQKPFIENCGGNSFSLYISVPFCPSRCSYCSFVSQSVEKSRKLIPDYVNKLCEELRVTGEIARKLGLTLKTMYIGGGTPTVLSEEELEAVMKTAAGAFDLSECSEYTVEAGRPDTITSSKLRVIKRGGAGRISINPQSMNEQVLSNIGRRHSPADIIKAFEAARALDFDNINMDVIIGLPGDTPESFRKTMEELISLSPENITVHALSLKHSSNMTTSGEIESHKNALAEIMAEESAELLDAAGYSPYYLYRQSRMAGNLENIGWSKENRACEYNIYTMEETQSIIACGAGAVSKIRNDSTDNIERIFNFKYSYEYLSRFDEIIGRKEKIVNLYEAFSEK